MASRILSRLNLIQSVYQIDASGQPVIAGTSKFDSVGFGTSGASMTADASGNLSGNRRIVAPSFGVGLASNSISADGSNNIVSSRTVSAPGMIVSGWKFAVDGSGNLTISL